LFLLLVLLLDWVNLLFPFPLIARSFRIMLTLAPREPHIYYIYYKNGTTRVQYLNYHQQIASISLDTSWCHFSN
ncbi:hypothetical protein IKE87_00300, partial [Candidatus Saccharibacteria bacterium]|nr:hypothetical protein [Candidatus Saccharibacteria bacterium]